MAKGTEIGHGYISISPNAAGFGRKLNAETAGPLADVGAKGGRSLGGRLGGALAAAAKVGIVAAGAAAVTTVGVIVKKGFDRALDIEDAKATLGALGYAAKEVQGITDDVLTSVRGTPFALNEAMSAAVSALAAGVPEGQNLTDYLKTIGDAATVAKVPFNDMAAIFNKVQGVGKVTGEVLAQMGERGIPILQWLADEYGVTADEMRSMVSRGEVDSAAFQKAIASNVGGAALAAGETTRGAWANMMAAMGRLGASFVEGILPQIRGGLEGMISLFDSLGPAATRLGEIVGQVFSIAKSVNLAGVWQGFLAAVAPVVAVLRDVWAVAKPLRDAFMNAASALMEALRPALADIWAGLKELMPVLKLVAAVVGVVLVAAFAVVVGAITAVSKLIGPFAQMFKGLATVVGQTVNFIAAILTGNWSAAWKAAQAAGQGVIDFIKGMFGASTFRNLFSGAVGVLTWLGDKFLAFKDRVVGYIRDLVAKITKPIEDAKNVLNRLNPFMRQSPSLVDNVLAGTKVIRSAYEGLSDMRISGASVSGVSAGYSSASPAAPGTSFAGATFQVNVPDGRVDTFLGELDRLVGTGRLKAQMMGAS